MNLTEDVYDKTYRFLWEANLGNTKAKHIKDILYGKSITDDGEKELTFDNLPVDQQRKIARKILKLAQNTERGFKFLPKKSNNDDKNKEEEENEVIRGFLKQDFSDQDRIINGAKVPVLYHKKLRDDGSLEPDAAKALRSGKDLGTDVRPNNIPSVISLFGKNKNGLVNLGLSRIGDKRADVLYRFNVDELNNFANGE